MINIIFFDNRALALLTLKETCTEKFSKNLNVEIVVSDKNFL